MTSTKKLPPKDMDNDERIIDENEAIESNTVIVTNDLIEFTLPSGPFVSFEEACNALHEYSALKGFSIITNRKRYRKRDGHSSSLVRCDFKDCPFLLRVYRPLNQDHWYIEEKNREHKHGEPLASNRDRCSVELDSVPTEIYATIPCGPFSAFREAFALIVEWCEGYSFYICTGPRIFAKEYSHVIVPIVCQHRTCRWKVLLIQTSDTHQWYLVKKQLQHNHPLNAQIVWQRQLFYQSIDATPVMLGNLNVLSYSSFPMGPYNSVEEGIETILNWCYRHGFEVIKGHKGTRKHSGHYLTEMWCPFYRITGCKWKIQIFLPKESAQWVGKIKDFRHNHLAGCHEVYTGSNLLETSHNLEERIAQLEAKLAQYDDRLQAMEATGASLYNI